MARETTTHVWTNKETQGTLTDFRQNGFTVTKTTWGYNIEDDGEQIFKAVNWNPAQYCVTYTSGIFGDEP